MILEKRNNLMRESLHLQIMNTLILYVILLESNIIQMYMLTITSEHFKGLYLL